MLLTITTTHRPAADLGYLLHKHPDRLQSEELAFGRAHVFYPEVSDERCTAALLLDVDPVALVRGRTRAAAEGSPQGTVDQYVNDRPYVASSFLSVAMTRLFRSAMAGTSKERQALADAPMPLTATVCSVPCRGGEGLLRKLFEPLGYDVSVETTPLDATYPEWGASRTVRLTLRAETRLRDLLAHLYVLIPVLDDAKHYWVGDDEVAKLLRQGEGWLAAHPSRELIARRYLKHRASLTRRALAQLLRSEGDGDAHGDGEVGGGGDGETREAEGENPSGADAHPGNAAGGGEVALERRVGLNALRIRAVVDALKSRAVRSVVELGCGDGKVLHAMAKETSFERVVGLDVSFRATEIARDRLGLDELPPGLPMLPPRRVDVWHGSLLYRDKRLEVFDAAAVIEVIEHLDHERLGAFERVLFEFARPRVIVLTTPNVEYNVHFENLPVGKFRHADHRFEWTRAEFSSWAESVARRFGYSVSFTPIGEERDGTGAPTQMAVFERARDAQRSVP
jgi:3' terminal RNA ribose 2'-O-methyltransferase Hen1